MLVAISIPIFTAQLEKSRVATNQANARNAYAAVSAELLAQSKSEGSGTYVVSTGKLKAAVSDSTTAGSINTATDAWTSTTETDLGKKTAKEWYVAIDSTGSVSFTPTY